MSYSMTSQELYGMVIQIAEKCTQLYHVLEQKVIDIDLKKTFNNLSLEGKAQTGLLKEFKASRFGFDVDRNFNLDKSLFYFSLISEAQKFSATDAENTTIELSDEIGSIQLAVSFEKDSILFWEELKNLTTGDLQQRIETFIKHKKERIAKLLQLKMNLMKN